MLRLRDEFTGNEVRAARGIGDDEHFRRPRERVDAARAEELPLRLGHPDVSRADDLVDARDRLRPECQRGDRLRATGGDNLVDAAEAAREERAAGNAPGAAGRRRDEHAPDAGDPRGDCGHHDR